MIHRFLISIVLIGCCLVGSSQIQQRSLPLSATEHLPKLDAFEELLVDMECTSRQSTASKVLQFACPIQTHLDPNNSGQWTATANGKVWRLGIYSKDAYSLYLNLKYQLRSGAKLFVYRPDYKDFKGAFTDQNNKKSGRLSIAPVTGDRLIIELNMPNELDSFGELRIVNVYHDFLNVFNHLEDSNPKYRTASCEQDINCENGIYWQTAKRSVVKILSDGGIGTGTLVGNTSGSITPYVLTANHLISSAEIAEDAIFVFNHESTACDGDLPIITNEISGSTLVATTEGLVDFTLMELSQPPPLSYGAYYSGWDARSVLPASGVTIHHPFGGAKEIAMDYHPLVNEDIGEGFDVNSTFKVEEWEIGVTSPGSSGAPLFNADHRLVGTLTGGRSQCNYPKDDYFTKFSVSWDTYANPENQLSAWLDPAQTGQMVLDGYDPYGFSSEFCEIAWNYSPDELLILDENWQSEGVTQFAERYEPAGSLMLNGIYLYIGNTNPSSPLSNIEVMVWDGGTQPEAAIYSRMVFLSELIPDQVNFISFDTLLHFNQPFFIGFTSNLAEEVSIYQVSDRKQSGPSTLWVNDGSWKESSEYFDVNTSAAIGLSSCYGTVSRPNRKSLVVYPNPATTSMQLDLPTNSPISTIACFDSSGREVPVRLCQSEIGDRLEFSLRPGIYFLKIQTLESNYSTRFVVI